MGTLKRFCFPLIFPVRKGASVTDRFANVELNAQQVRDDVHILTGAGCNIGVNSGDDGVYGFTRNMRNLFNTLSKEILIGGLCAGLQTNTSTS